MDKNAQCCSNCKFAFGNNDNLYCSKVGFKTAEYIGCFAFESKYENKEAADEKSDNDR